MSNNGNFFEITRIYQQENEDGSTELKTQRYTINRNFIVSVRPSNRLTPNLSNEGESSSTSQWLDNNPQNEPTTQHRTTIVVGNQEVHAQEKYSKMKELAGIGN